MTFGKSNSYSENRMAKVVAPGISLGAKGTVGDALTFQMKGLGHAVYKYSPASKETYDSPTEAQQTQRSRIAQLVEDWKNLSAEWRTAWENAAEAAGYHAAGYHYFIHLGGAGVPPPFVPTAFYILNEEGGKILAEDGYGILQEEAP